MALRGYRETIARLHIEIEERRKVEQDLRQANLELSRQPSVFEQLAQAPAVQTDELLRSNEELLRSNRELDDFAYIASHDLKEPLRAIFNHASFLLEDYEEKLDYVGKRRLNRLIKLSRRMERLIADLLYFSRLGRGDHATEIVDLSEVIANIEASLSDTLQSRNAHINLSAPLPPVSGPRQLISFDCSLSEPH